MFPQNAMMNGLQYVQGRFLLHPHIWGQECQGGAETPHIWGLHKRLSQNL